MVAIISLAAKANRPERTFGFSCFGFPCLVKVPTGDHLVCQVRPGQVSHMSFWLDLNMMDSPDSRDLL